MNRSALLLALLPCALACDEFDPALYMAAESNTTELSNSCASDDVPLMVPDGQFFRVNLEPLGDTWQVDNCTEQGAEGNDGFFAVDMEAGRAYHFHINAIDVIDPVVYVVDSCDERVCRALNTAATCASDREHLSFVAPRTARYFIGVDGTDAGGGTVEVLAVAPACGNGDKEHSEACDDGNREDGDGCSAECRLELTRSGREAREPNDDFISANFIGLQEAGEFSVRGDVDSPCDPEMYALRPSVDLTLSAHVLGPDGDPCDGISPEVTLELELFEGQESIARDRTVGACPELTDEPLVAERDGEPLQYFVRLTSLGSDIPTIEYTLDVTLQ
jgi:cysteine-rich repeat protein